MKSIAVVGCAAALMATAVPVSAQQARAIRDAKYRIGTMERILEGAAEHGAKGAQERFKAMMPGDFLLTDDVHVRGFTIGDWGVFFDVQMPPLESTTPWIVQTLNQSDLTIQNALRNLMSMAEASPDPAVRQQNMQYVERVSLQLGVPSRPVDTPPVTTQTAQAAVQSARPVEAASLVAEPAGAATKAVSAPAASTVSAVSADDPQAAFHAEVKAATIDAMLEHGASLRLRPEQRFMVAIRGADNLPRLAPGEPESPTIQITILGADLNAAASNQLTRDEVLKRIVVEEVP